MKPQVMTLLFALLAVSLTQAAAAARDVTTLAAANAYTYAQATIDAAIASSASTLTARPRSWPASPTTRS